MPLNQDDLNDIAAAVQAQAKEQAKRDRSGTFTTIQVTPELRDLVKHLAAIDHRSQPQEVYYLVEQEYARRGIPLPVE